MEDTKETPRNPAPKVQQVLKQGKVTYEQQRVRCGKQSCAICKMPQGTENGHGPYWYMSFNALGRERRAYIGKDLDLRKHRVGHLVDYRRQAWWKRLLMACGRMTPKRAGIFPDNVLPIELGAVCAHYSIETNPFPPRTVAAAAWLKGFGEHTDLMAVAGPDPDDPETTANETTASVE